MAVKLAVYSLICPNVQKHTLNWQLLSLKPKEQSKPFVQGPLVDCVLHVVQDLYVHDHLSLRIYNALVYHLALLILFLVLVVSFPYHLVPLLVLLLVL